MKFLLRNKIYWVDICALVYQNHEQSTIADYFDSLNETCTSLSPLKVFKRNTILI